MKFLSLCLIGFSVIYFRRRCTNSGDNDGDVLLTLEPIGRLLSWVGLLTESMTDMMTVVCCSWLLIGLLTVMTMICWDCRLGSLGRRFWSYELVDNKFGDDGVELELLKAMGLLIDGEDGDGGVAYGLNIYGLDDSL